MRTRNILILLLAALTSGLFSCQGDSNAPEPGKSFDLDKMAGTWKLVSYTEKWVNVDEDEVEIDRTVNQGTLTVKKETDGEDTYYTYTENFVSEDCKEYSGRIELTDGYICLNDPEGFLRGDKANTYDYTVTFPAAGEMEWSYNWSGKHLHNGVAHNDRRTVKAIFTKQQ